MRADTILTGVAMLFMISVIWDDLHSGGRMTIARRTRLAVAALLTGVSLLLQVFVR